MPSQPPSSDSRPEGATDSGPRPDGQRIAKLLARAGVASRREIERMIADGRVALNGTVLDTPATILSNLKGVTVDGNPVSAAEATRLFAFHKPTGLITAERDMAGRPTIYTALRNALPGGTPRLMPVGRLDLNTEGLLLLTNDGGLKRMMELPSTKVPRTYRARAFGEVQQSQLEDLIEGVEIDGVRYGAIDANLERGTGRNVWVQMTITEGKNREVRRVLEYLGLKVNRLIRTGYGPFDLGDLPRGQAVELTGKPVARFLSEMTGEPIPRGGVKKADKVEISAPVKAPRPPRPPARKGPSARPAPRKVADAAASPRKASDAPASKDRKAPTGSPAPRKGAETLTNAPRKGRDGPNTTRPGSRSRKRPAPTRGNTPPRAPRK
ncbi:pseudouridine synthase [Porphyrobacter sp. AAP60]|uniref:pseudouridine synthase n=1 Tax=Porphyrobacter sp. AAP60 TaxID=1523423 RepID=UPI000AD7AD96|nr:pseudouridine synthase [Porphyrobacter sp. AAP60]